jgi:regulator of sigma E protease
VPESKGGQLSIGVDGIFVDTYQDSERYPFFQAIAKGGEYLIEMPSMMVDAISAMGGDYSDAVVGPVGVVQITGETTKYGFGAIIGLAGLISFGIGLFNLFPVPPLDGGGILIAGVEGVRRGKRLSPRAMQLTYAIGAALLFTLFIMITYNDILRLIRGDNILP